MRGESCRRHGQRGREQEEEPREHMKNATCILPRSIRQPVELHVYLPGQARLQGDYGGK